MGIAANFFQVIFKPIVQYKVLNMGKTALKANNLDAIERSLTATQNTINAVQQKSYLNFKLPPSKLLRMKQQLLDAKSLHQISTAAHLSHFTQQNAQPVSTGVFIPIAQTSRQRVAKEHSPAGASAQRLARGLVHLDQRLEPLIKQFNQHFDFNYRDFEFNANLLQLECQLKHYSVKEKGDLIVLTAKLTALEELKSRSNPLQKNNTSVCPNSLSNLKRIEQALTHNLTHATQPSTLVTFALIDDCRKQLTHKQIEIERLPLHHDDTAYNTLQKEFTQILNEFSLLQRYGSR